MSIRGFLGLHHILTPTSYSCEEICVETNGISLAKRSRKQQISDKKRLSKQEKLRKPSIEDSKMSTILLIKYNNKVGEEVINFAKSQMKLKKLAFHPIMAIHLDSNNEPSKYFLYIDHIYMEAYSFKDLLSSYIQSFFVFDLDFPKEGKLICQFLSEMFFEQKSGNPRVANLITELNSTINGN